MASSLEAYLQQIGLVPALLSPTQNLLPVSTSNSENTIISQSITNRSTSVPAAGSSSLKDISTTTLENDRSLFGPKTSINTVTDTQSTHKLLAATTIYPTTSVFKTSEEFIRPTHISESRFDAFAQGTESMYSTTNRKTEGAIFDDVLMPPVLPLTLPANISTRNLISHVPTQLDSGNWKSDITVEPQVSQVQVHQQAGIGVNCCVTGKSEADMNRSNTSTKTGFHNHSPFLETSSEMTALGIVLQRPTVQWSALGCRNNPTQVTQTRKATSNTVTTAAVGDYGNHVAINQDQVPQIPNTVSDLVISNDSQENQQNQLLSILSSKQPDNIHSTGHISIPEVHHQTVGVTVATLPVQVTGEKSYLAKCNQVNQKSLHPLQPLDRVREDYKLDSCHCTQSSDRATKVYFSHIAETEQNSKQNLLGHLPCSDHAITYEQPCISETILFDCSQLESGVANLIPERSIQATPINRSRSSFESETRVTDEADIKHVQPIIKSSLKKAIPNAARKCVTFSGSDLVHVEEYTVSPATPSSDLFLPGFPNLENIFELNDSVFGDSEFCQGVPCNGPRVPWFDPFRETDLADSLHNSTYNGGDASLPSFTNDVFGRTTIFVTSGAFWPAESGKFNGKTMNDLDGIQNHPRKLSAGTLSGIKSHRTLVKVNFIQGLLDINHNPGQTSEIDSKAVQEIGSINSTFMYNGSSTFQNNSESKASKKSLFKDVTLRSISQKQTIICLKLSRYKYEIIAIIVAVFVLMSLAIGLGIGLSP